MRRLSEKQTERNIEAALPFYGEKGQVHLHPSGSRRKHQRSCLTIAIICLVFIVRQVIFLETPSNQHSNTHPRPTKIMVFNGRAFHDEVYAAFLEALSKLGNIETSTMLLAPRWNMQHIISKFVWESSYSEETFPLDEKNMNLASAPSLRYMDIFLDITCSADIFVYSNLYYDLFLNSSVNLHCVIHHADLFDPSTDRYAALRPWAKARRLRILTLSQHVKGRLQNHWQGDQVFEAVPVEVFVPVFTALLPSSQVLIDEKAASSVPYLAIQGAVSRRNNTEAFLEYEQQLEIRNTYTMGQPVPQLVFVGNGKLEVPDNLQNLVQQMQTLDYPQFYATLAGSTAIIPAIVGDEYTREAASSTFPAAIISGIPPVMSSDLLAAYSYFPKSAVIQQRKDESAMAAAFRFLHSSASEQQNIVKELRLLRDKIIEENACKIDRWAQIDRARLLDFL